ncbi:TPA_exp: Uncharacterized protein A8136_5470 [Trichophyton benhamiae CBS 112371]|uniref:Major facilitator superfamily transporter n=1 Tax=Arthroderma benhamiae (strain ATCC MYA-4681 / CBS 112371) TaxID=663331 RepID=D4B5D2_ARTBC|nr:uncharacterized protein ARB_03672 [Trichophyton benhamiae CBS 112371]EFE29465.1 hypothetical protein ARB_03672 [Trichophyton benhamiae CBS 112371]DAA72744.1 TPA_exp: Uncharacterized protein A8136_5470 [Trichophyton benhamiae CBS 112371]
MAPRSTSGSSRASSGPRIKIDTEKYSPYDHDEEYGSHSEFSYATSASESSASRPFLSQSKYRRRPGVRLYRVPNSIMRWVCLGVFAGLVLFVFTLFRVTLSQAIFKIPAPPPPNIFKPQPPEWESFPFLLRYYGGLRTLTPKNESAPEYPGGNDGQDNSTAEEPVDMDRVVKSTPFNPYPEFSSKSYVEKYGRKVDCFMDPERKISVPQVRRYDGLPRGFPDSVIGSNELIGLETNACYDRFGRLGPYGLGYGVRSGGTGAGLEGDRSGVDHMWENTSPVDYRKVKWAKAQKQCLHDNRHRFPLPLAPKTDRFLGMSVGEKTPRGAETTQNGAPKNATTPSTTKLPRTAVIIRTWSEFKYDTETILYLRSLIAELSLFSGGEFDVQFLIHVKDDNLQIWSDEDTYNRVLQESLPEEFQGMGTLWSERQMGLIYGGLEESFARNLPVHGVYRSTFMPVQYFALQHPEYDYFWNWEMDARYTGHWYDLFNKMRLWAKEQPRKGLWERNSRFYVPSVHGSWEDFRHTVRVQTEHGTASPNNMFSATSKERPNGHRPTEMKGDRPIWGPERPPAENDVLELEDDGIPPTTYEKDKFEWGVGEEADLIVLNPLYDPDGTTWLLKDDITGYNKSEEAPPRRAAIIAASRLSRKLLLTMHKETSLKRHHMFSEMWPPTVALHHGYKAVYVPHSVYIDRRWPTAYLESVFNAGRNGATGGARTSVFGNREHNFRGTTWYYSAGHSENLWRRWLGYRSNNDGGEEYELANEGRMCLPPMLLHPIKEVNMVIDSAGRS